MEDYRDEYRAMRRCLTTPDGQVLLRHALLRFAERRTRTQEQLANGQIVDRIARTSSFVPGDVYETVLNEGSRRVVLWLQDMAEWEG